MPEVTAAQASEILDISHPTLFRRVDEGTLPARRVGIGKLIRIDVQDLRTFAQEYQYRIDEELLSRYAE